MTSVGAPVAATASTARSTSACRVPASSDAWWAAWMTGPSISGSLYGMPISTTSTPASTIATSASTEAS